MWIVALRRYLIASAIGHLVWEFAQLPLYTIWREGKAGHILFAAVHCAGADLLIALCSLIAAILLTSKRDWPLGGYGSVAVLAIALGLAFTVFSEWLNTEVRRTWAYSELMPTLAFLGTGLSPLAQWLVVPAAAFWLARYKLVEADSS